MVVVCSKEAFCRTVAEQFVKVVVILYDDGFIDLGASTSRTGEKVNLSMVGVGAPKWLHL